VAGFVKSGERDRLITLQQKTYTLDGFGGEVITWTTIGQRWASSMPVKDGERFGNQEAIATITHRFRISWDQAAAQVDPTYRVLFDNRLYDVVAVKEIGRREGIEISATARAENG
jgi:SPP1 family predicted phage head-tail adaptor